MASEYDDELERMQAATADRAVGSLWDAGELDPIVQAEYVHHLWQVMADFHLFVVQPAIPPIEPALYIPAEVFPESNREEFVYPIYDYGYKLSASKAQDFGKADGSMCKLYFTIEKMVSLFVERLKTAGVDPKEEVQVAFGGHELAQRKAFESVINLSYNVVVTNFNPGMWGERYLQAIQRIADKGYGYPPESPRDTYRQDFGAQSVKGA